MDEHETAHGAGRGSGRDAAPVRAAERSALARALQLAALGPAHGPNPRVGCVLLAPDGTVLAEGHHRGAGTPHAEADAVARAQAAGATLRGATAVVTLEPCAHTGRTGPCADLLVDAGLTRVVHAAPDPSPVAGGGGARLADAGVEVVLLPADDDHRRAAEQLTETWRHAVTRGRPFVTLKTATTLDGRVAARDGTSRWITSAAAREHAHAVRARVDAVVVGTGTVALDDPALTARLPDGSDADHQPLRVVVGHRDVPEHARIRRSGGPWLHVRTHDVHEVLAELARREVRHAVVEGGPVLAAAFLRARVVDEVHAYVAPVLLGAGRPALDDLGITTMSEAVRLVPTSTTQLGPDVLVVARPTHPEV